MRWRSGNILRESDKHAAGRTARFDPEETAMKTILYASAAALALA